MAQTRILIVEDEVLTAESLRTALERLGYTVSGMLDSGEEAVDQAGELRPDLVLMDIKLQGTMDGIEAAGQIRERYGIPVVYVTALADDETLHRAQASEPFGYVLKPCRVNDLRSAVEMALLRHRMDERLKASEARYRAVVEDQTELICRFAPDGALVFANDAYCRYFGREREALLGRYFMPPTSKEERAETYRCLSTLSPEEPVVTVEQQVALDGGEVRWLRWIYRAMFDAGRRPREIQAVGRDVTERREAEEQLQRQNRFLKTIIESLNHPFYVVNVDDYSIEMANSAARSGELSGQITCYTLAHGRKQPCATARHPCPIEEIRRTGQPLTVEHLHVAPGGELRPIEVHAHPVLDAEGQVVQVIEYCLDITRRKQAEQEREALIGQLQDALARVKTLSGLLPICASCKKIRDDQGYWTQVEVYIRQHSEARFSHGICPECARKLYPQVFQDREAAPRTSLEDPEAP